MADPIHFVAKQARQDTSTIYNVPLEDSEKHKVEYEAHRLVVNRDPKFTNFVEAIIERMGEVQKLDQT